MLSVSPELLGVSVLPVGAAGGSGLDGAVTLLEHTSGLLAGGGEASELSVSVLGRADPVDAGVSTDGLVVGVDKDDFVELEASILSNPVGGEDSQVGALASNTLFSDGLVSSLFLELADTLVDGLTEDATLLHGLLTSSSANTDSVDNVSLLGLVADLSRLVGAGRLVSLVDDGQLSVLPGSNSEDETKEIGLLLSPQLFEVFVGSHLFY